MNFSTIEHMPRKLTRTGKRKAFNVSYITVQSDTLDVSGQDTAVEDILMSPDGTMFYVVGNTNDTIYQYQLCVPYLPATAETYASKDVSAETTDPTAMSFNSDGSIMYVADGGGIVYLYDLSTEYDVSTAVYSEDTIDFTDDTIDIVSISINPNGNIIITDGGGTIYQYPISDQFVGYIGAAKGFDATTTIYSIQAKPDGTKIYCSFNNVAAIHTYSFSTGWNFSTVTGPVNQAFVNLIRYWHISSNGVKVFTVPNTSNVISSYTLSTPWDLSTRSANTDYTFTETNYIYSMYLSDDGYHFILVGRDSDTNYYLYKYTLGTAFDLSTRSYITKVLSDAGNTPAWFNITGTTMIRSGYSTIYPYTLSTPFDISTITAQDTFSFLPVYHNINVDTGRILYRSNIYTDEIWQAFLTNMGNASSLDITSETTNAASMVFSDDGNFHITLDADGDELLQYYTTSPYVIDSGGYQNIAVDPSLTTPTAVDISSIAGYVYVFDANNDFIYTYDLV